MRMQAILLLPFILCVLANNTSYDQSFWSNMPSLEDTPWYIDDINNSMDHYDFISPSISEMNDPFDSIDFEVEPQIENVVPTRRGRPRSSRRSSSQRQSVTNVQATDPSRQFFCPLCSRAFRRREHCKRHYETVHVGERPFVCYNCSKAFSRSDNLQAHIQSVHL